MRGVAVVWQRSRHAACPWLLTHHGELHAGSVAMGGRGRVLS